MMNELEEDLIIGDSNDSIAPNNNDFETTVIPESPDKLDGELPESKMLSE